MKFKIMLHFSELLKEMANTNNYGIKFYPNRQFGEKDSAVIFSKPGLNHEVNFYFENDFEYLISGIVDLKDAWIIKPVEFAEWSITAWKDVYKGVLVDVIKLKLESYFHQIENTQ